MLCFVEATVAPPTYGLPPAAFLTTCQKLNHCSTFIVYNEVHYHIPSVVIFRKLKEKQTEKMQISEEGYYIIREREEEEDRRERTSLINIVVYHIFIM